MNRFSSFSARWLFETGIPEERLSERIAYARRRGRRFDRPLGWLYPIACWFTDTLAPLFLLGRFRRARNLADEDFQRLLDGMRSHPLMTVRALSLLVTMPLMDALTEEPAPPPIPHPLEEELKKPRPRKEEFDLIVIGSGAGGAPVAWDLSRRGLKVAMIEKGPLVRPEAAPRATEKYYVYQGVLSSLTGSIIPVLAGSAIGGTTPVNSGTCLRPLKECLEIWDRQCGTDFAKGGLDRWLDEVEKKIGVTVNPRSLMSQSSLLMEEGLRKIGRSDSYLLPRNVPDCQGSGRCCFVCPTGAKLGTDRAFLPEAAAAGMTLIPRSRATWIREEKATVVVEIEGKGGKSSLRSKHLVLAGGGLFTPGLIRRNRLGSRWRLAGRGLKIHPASKVNAFFPNLDHGEGGIPQGLGYHPPEIPRVSFEGIHVPKSILGPTLPNAGRSFAWWMHQADHLAGFGLFVRDRSTGTVSEWGGNPLVRYRLHPEDARDLAAGILLIAEAFFAAGAQRVLLPAVGVPNEPKGLEELKKLRPENFTAKKLILSGFHPQGTAAIGRLVDSNLKLIGSDRIWVSDASVFPDSPGANPMVTIMALSLRLADHLAGRSG